MDFARRSRLIAHAVAIGAVLLATVITFYTPALRSNHSLLFYLAAVTITAWYGGLFPSLLAITLSAISFAYFIAPPAGFRISDAEDKVRLGLFMLVAILISSLHGARVRAERAARSLGQRLAFALDATDMGVWDLNFRTGAVWCSPSLGHIYGRTPEQCAKTYEAFLGQIHPEDRDFVHRTVTRTMESGQEYQIEHRIVLPDGSVKRVTTRGRVFLAPNGTPERLVAVAADLTNRRGVLRPGAAAPSAYFDDTTLSSMPGPASAGAGLL